MSAASSGPIRWQPSELGPRYPTMVKRIVGCRARVTGLSGKFKLGQNERPEVLAHDFGRIAPSLPATFKRCSAAGSFRSEEHTSELQSLMRSSYAVLCLKKKKKQS